MDRVKGKVALITGAAQGIGRITSLLLAQEGAKVVATDLKEGQGKKVASIIQKRGGEAIFIKHDVSIENDWQKVIGKTLETFSKLDVLVNNAGRQLLRERVEEVTLEDSHLLMAVNWDGVLLGTKYGIEAMKKGKGGSIINLCSIAAFRGNTDSSVYNASKGAVKVFTKCAAIQCCKAGYKIRVNNICPGFIWTGLLHDWAKNIGEGEIEAGRKKIEDFVPMGRLGKPEDIAYGILYLASDESSFVTGAELVIDGGSTAK